METASRVLFLAVLASCGPQLYPVPANPIGDPNLLLARMAARKEAARTLNAVGRVENYSKGGVFKGRVTILAETPGRLRVDGWSPSDDLVSALSAGPEGFIFFQRGAEECLAGETCRENLARFLPIGLVVGDAVSALFGFPPVLPAESSWSVEFDRRAGAYRVSSLSKGGMAQDIWVREDGVPVRAVYTRDGLQEYRMECAEFRAVGGIDLPHRLRLLSRRYESDLSVRYRSAEVNSAIAAEDWKIECPKGLGTRILPCEGDR